MKGYSLGKEGIEKILGGNQLQMLITGASAMGAIVLGALSAQFVTVKCSAIIKLGALKMNVQETVFDQLFQGILPLAVTLFTLYPAEEQEDESHNCYVDSGCHRSCIRCGRLLRCIIY